MRILLVRPPRIKQAITLSNFMFSEPLGLEMVYGVFDSSSEVEIFDMMVEKTGLTSKLKEYNPDIVGITSLCIDVLKVIELSKEVKDYSIDIKTFVGGTQALLSPESFFVESIDYVFNYTSRANLEAFIKGNPQIEGVYQRTNDYKDKFPKGRNEYLLPDRKSTQKHRAQYSYFGYRPAAIMEYGLGCSSRCDFCLRWRIEGHEEVGIDRDITVSDLKSIEEETIMFIDNDFLGNRDKLQGFIDLIKSLNIDKNYIVYGSVRGVLANRDLVAELSDLGLKAILIGYETFSDDELINYHKNITTADNMEASKILADLQIDVWASFMAHPDWDKKDFAMFRRYIKGLAPQIATINPLTPFPGLPIYHTYRDRLLFDALDYEKWSFGQMIIRPSKLSVRRYYYELMKTYLYVNLFVNGNTEMIKKFGVKNSFRIGIGAIRASIRYIRLMWGR